MVGFGGKKDNSRRLGIPAQKKAQRKADAQVRQAVYESLSTEQRLKLAGPKVKAKLLKANKG